MVLDLSAVYKEATPRHLCHVALSSTPTYFYAGFQNTKHVLLTLVDFTTIDLVESVTPTYLTTFSIMTLILF